MQTYDITSFFLFLISPLFVLFFFIFSPLVVIHRSSSLVRLWVCVCVGGGEGRVPGWLPRRTCEMRHGVESIHNHMHLQSFYNNQRDKTYRWRQRQQSISSPSIPLSHSTFADVFNICQQQHPLSNKLENCLQPCLLFSFFLSFFFSSFYLVYSFFSFFSHFFFWGGGGGIFIFFLVLFCIVGLVSDFLEPFLFDF